MKKERKLYYWITTCASCKHSGTIHTLEWLTKFNMSRRAFVFEYYCKSKFNNSYKSIQYCCQFYIVGKHIRWRLFWYTRLFYKQRFSSTQPQCYLNFSWIKLQMLLRCSLVHINIIILRHFLHLLHLCPCLDLGLFTSYLWDLFLIFIFIFITINRVFSWVKTNWLFCLFFRICPNIFGW